MPDSPRRSSQPAPPPGEQPQPAWMVISGDKALDLHARLVARDERALEEFIEIATPWLLSLSYGILSDPDDAEEVLQEAFNIVWNRVGTVVPEPRGLMAWVVRVVRNRAIDRLRSRKRWLRKMQRLFEIGIESDSFVTPREPNEVATPGWHLHQTVHTALGILPADQQIAVQLSFFQGLTHSEIARRLDIPIGTVKTRLSLAYEKLRRELGAMKDWIL